MGDATAPGSCFLKRSRSTSSPDSDLITTRFGVKAFAFEFRRERPPPGAVLDAGVEGVDDEMLPRLAVWVCGEGVECGGWAFGGRAGVSVGVPGAWSGGCCPLGDIGRPGIGAPGGPCGGCCCGMCCGIHCAGG